MKAVPKAEYLFFEKLKNSIKDHQTYDEIMKCFYLYIEGILSQYEFFDLVTELFENNNSEEMLTTLKSMMTNRDNGRRH
jgi:histone deacetylase complex regulatory component SIN3